jgi:hypothetical protein
MRAGALIERVSGPLRTRAALGLRPLTLPVMLLVPIGVALGPAGSGLITRSALPYLDVVISVALATLGVFVGIAFGAQEGRVKRLVAAATIEGSTAGAAVAAATFFLLQTWQMPLDLTPLVAALALGIAASASAAPYVGAADDRARQVAAQVADLDDVLPIVAGGVVLSLVATGGTERIVADLAVTIAAGLAGGVSGWLLFERSDPAERGVFVIGTLALLGGLAGYLGTSPLIAGMAAGYVWARTPGHTDRIAADDLQKVQHPLVVLLLLTAGASLQLSLAGIWLFAPYVLFRIAGKLLGGWLASRLAPGVAPSDLGAYLIPPGVLGIAFALNLQQVAGEAATPLLFAVSLGAVASEIAALLVTPVPRQG